MIRPGHAKDHLAMGAILSDWIDTTPWMPRLYTRQQDSGFCRHLLGATDVQVWEENSQVIGFVAIGDDIPALYVGAPAQGRGVGSALLQMAKAKRPAGFTLWTFQANIDARRFYDRHGFTEVARTDGANNDEKLPDVQLSWSV